MRISCLQYTAEPDLSESMARLRPLLDQAADSRPDCILLPECALFLSNHQKRSRDAALAMDSEPVQALQEAARTYGITLIVGSLIMRIGEAIKNRQLVIQPDGSVGAVYDKLHLFDVTLANGESYRESALFEAGDSSLITETAGCLFGHSICFDLRFPALYRAYAQAGVHCLLVPAAFTQTTGTAHWLTLLRARAIENGAFVVAAGQCGTTSEGRQTFGHSVVYDPWGDCLGQLQSDPGVLTVDLDLARVSQVRRQIPVLDAERSFGGNANQ